MLRLEIPKIGVDEIVVSGVGVDQLKLGPGHFPETPYPGEPGNAAIAGHRTTYGAPFFALDELVAGDEIITTTALGRYVYRVSEITIVSPSDIGVLAPTDDSRLTLTSCHPRYSARERLIVSALLDPPIAPPTPESTAPPPTAAAVAVATTIVPSTTTLAPTTTTTTVAVARATSPPTAPTTTMAVASAVGGTLPGAPLPVPDASGLGGGWFADAGAWPHVLLWGAACSAVVALAVMLGRRAGHRSLGWLAGAAPFVVGLYFFYENVNRLVPAGV